MVIPFLIEQNQCICRRLKNEEKYISEKHEDKRKKWHDELDQGSFRIYGYYTIKRVEKICRSNP